MKATVGLVIVVFVGVYFVLQGLVNLLSL